MTINKRPNWFVDNVEANDDYTLLLTFITGEIKLFDFKPLLDDNYFGLIN